jgi:hypothetical protein
MIITRRVLSQIASDPDSFPIHLLNDIDSASLGDFTISQFHAFGASVDTDAGMTHHTKASHQQDTQSPMTASTTALFNTTDKYHYSELFDASVDSDSVYFDNLAREYGGISPSTTHLQSPGAIRSLRQVHPRQPAPLGTMSGLLEFTDDIIINQSFLSDIPLNDLAAPTSDIVVGFALPCEE